jgi:hypothetical protein
VTAAAALPAPVAEVPPPQVWIVPDQPAITAALGFQEYAAALADAIRGGGPGRFTVGLYGPWGSGKSTLLGAIKERLSEDGQVVLAEFDAWRYARSNHIIVPLLHAVHAAAKDSGLAALQENLRRALESLVFSLSFKVGGAGVDAKAARDTWREGGLPALDSAFAAPFSTLREIPRTLDGRRVVVLIDDLDRCSPSRVVALLEAVNVVMDIDGFVFVLALDFDVLTEAIRRQFPHVERPALFVEKMVQIPFRVPPIDIDRPQFLDELLPDWEAHFQALPDRVRDRVVDMARFGLERNPRQLKRLLNTFGVVRRILQLKGMDVPDELLLSVLALQLKWPADYLALQEAVLTGDSDPLGALRTDATDPALDQFRSRFLDAVTDFDPLRAIVGLAAAVSLPAPSAADPYESAQAKTARQRNLEIQVSSDEIVASYIDLSAKAPNALFDRDRQLTLDGARARGPNEYGATLLGFLPEEVRQVWDRAMADASLSSGERVRISLTLDPVPDLNEPWWETLPSAGEGSTGGGVASSKRTPLSRRVAGATRQRRRQPVRPPLRALIAGPQPTELRDDPGARFEIIALSGERFTLAELRTSLDSARPHVVHLETAWRSSPEEQELALQVGDTWVRTEIIADLMLDVESLRLLVLSSPSDSTEPLPAGSVRTLVARGIPAVLGVREPLPDPPRTSAIQTVLSNVARGVPLDEAVNDARAQLRYASPDPNDWSWATPVLYVGDAYPPGSGIVEPDESSATAPPALPAERASPSA